MKLLNIKSRTFWIILFAVIKAIRDFLRQWLSFRLIAPCRMRAKIDALWENFLGVTAHVFILLQLLLSKFPRLYFKVGSVQCSPGFTEFNLSCLVLTWKGKMLLHLFIRLGNKSFLPQREISERGTRRIDARTMFVVSLSLKLRALS